LQGGTMTVDSGGLIFDTAGVAPTTNFKFGPSPGGTFTAGEAVVFVVSGKTPTLNGTLTATNLTVAGTGTGSVIVASNNSTTLTGTVTLNSAALQFQSANGTNTLLLNSASNIVLNGGTLNVLIDGTGTGQTFAY